jgi:hypothetical protein
MAKESGSEQSPDSVKLEIERSRARVAREVSGLRYELDIPAKLRRSFQHNTMVWVGAAVAVGAVLVYLPRSRKTVYVDVERGGKKKGKILEAGFVLGALRIAATLLKPALLNFVKNKMSGERGAFPRGPRKW